MCKSLTILYTISSLSFTHLSTNLIFQLINYVEYFVEKVDTTYNKNNKLQEIYTLVYIYTYVYVNLYPSISNPLASGAAHRWHPRDDL